MRVIERAAIVSGVPVNVLRGPSRLRGICLIRWAAMAAMRQRGMSYPAIGRQMGKHHTTVLSGLRQAQIYAASHPKYAKLMEDISEAVGPDLADDSQGSECPSTALLSHVHGDEVGAIQI